MNNSIVQSTKYTTSTKKQLSNLTVFAQDGLELVIDSQSGEVFASQSAIARMCNKDTTDSTLRRFLKGVSKLPVKNTEILTQGGLQGVSLYDEDTIYEAFEKFHPKLLVQCAKAGIRVFLHRLAGFEIQSTATFQIPQSPAEALRLAADLWEQKEKLEAAKLQLQEKVDELFNYSSIVRVATFNGISEKSFGWQELKVATKLLGLEIKKAPCPRFGEKNLYPHEAWTKLYPQIKLPEDAE